MNSGETEDWLDEQRKVLKSFSGKTVDEVWIVEMGLYGPDDAPLFEHPDLELTQCTVVELRFADKSTLHIQTWQDNAEFALWPLEASAKDHLKPNAEPSLTLFRTRQLPDISSGAFDLVDVGEDDQRRIQRLVLKIGKAEFILCAGEVYEIDRNLTVATCDESVLLFRSQSAFATTVFNEPFYTIPD